MDTAGVVESMGGRAGRLADAFRARTGRTPAGVWAAPGRVNLIGEHTDYNDGFVLPLAIDRSVLAAVGAPRGGRLACWSLQEAATVDLALADLNDLDIAGLERAKLARRAENAFVGAPTGLMDQAASTLCTRGHALFFDCRTAEAEQVLFDTASAAMEILVLDTKTPHALVDSEYAARRASCEEAARLLGVAALRDVTDLDSALQRLPDPVIQRRVRHVVSENARVLEAVEVLRAGRIADLAPLLDASHASMRDDFEITVPQVDLAVETARASGALGARMTGGGFGGCIIALVPAGDVERIGSDIARGFADTGYGPPAHFAAHPSAGAQRLQ